MKNNKGFTLVELLAVIAILAILVIIALPNVMGMFNEAKKNSFMTEVKEVYKVAQQTWISDSLFNTSERVYSRCDGCTDKSLELTGRTEFKYYIKFNKAGDVTNYYATDGTYQYKYEGNNLLVTDITNAETIADLPDSEVLHLDSGGSYYGNDSNCRYKIVTETGSFSSDPNDKEICMSSIDNSFVYTSNELIDAGLSYTGVYLGIPYKYEDFTSNSSYIRVYENNTKSNLIKEIKKSDFSAERFNLNDSEFLSNYNRWFALGNYNQDNLYFEASSDILNNTKYHYESYNTSSTLRRNTPINYHLTFPDLNGGHRLENVSVSGPWVSDSTVISKIKYFASNNINFIITNCKEVEPGNKVCGGNTYYVTFFSPGI